MKTPKIEMKNIGYERVSTGGQHNENQSPALREWASQHGVTLTILPEVESTRKTRPVRESIMQSVRKGHTKLIVVAKLDRWARDLVELIVSLDEIHSHGCQFVSIGDAGEIGTGAAGRMMVTCLGMLAQFERDRIRERTLEGLARSRAIGRVGGRPRKWCRECGELLSVCGGVHGIKGA